MYRTCAFAALTIALIAGSGSPAASADDAAALSAKVDGAIASAASYRVAVQGPGGMSIEILSVGPDRVRIVSTVGGATSESVVVGTSMYHRTSGGAWQSFAVPAIKRVRKNRLYMGAADTTLRPLADRTEADATWGAFNSQAQGNSQLPGSMDCTYDKTTYRPRACTIVVLGLPAPLRVIYDKWNDPANAVDAPAGVAPPTPAPAPTPGAVPGVVRPTPPSAPAPAAPH
jgi:hypothetical protein